jgi:predicted flap endonuclease-1-like 5' DNA nuclease
MSLLPSGTGTITTIHLILILLVAIAAIAMIVAGIRRKRLRAEADRQLDRHAEEAGMEAPSAATPDRAPPPLAPAPVPAPVAPPPAPRPFVAEPVAPVAFADEPIAAAAPLDASPAAEAIDPSPASADADAADGPVTQLKGLGPKVAARLAELGITRIGQIAALDDAGAAALDAQLGAFSGRVTRDRWVEQARFLSAGDRAGFEAVFGRL